MTDWLGRVLADIEEANRVRRAGEQARVEEPKDGLLEVIKFDSYAEQVDELMKISGSINHLVNNGDRGFQSRTWVPGSPRFNVDYVGRRFNNWKEVEQAANALWPHGMEVIQEMLDALREVALPRPQNIRRQRTWSEDTGDEICLDRMKRGQPYWRTTHRDHRPGPLSVTIVTDLETSMYVKPDDILWRGASAICLTQLLEEAGYRVELWTAAHSGSSEDRSKEFLNATCLKRGGEPIDLSSFVNAVSGWSYRTINFG